MLRGGRDVIFFSRIFVILTLTALFSHNLQPRQGIDTAYSRTSNKEQRTTIKNEKEKNYRLQKKVHKYRNNTNS
jgi:uncharacterized protein YlxW (UPF0749 family)